MFITISRLINGGELFDEIAKRKHMSEMDAAFVIKQILSAIAYCHSKNVVHRDLKPENVLITSIQEDGKVNVKIVDFGAALFMSSEIKLKETMGTPYYIAPEVIKGNYTEKCDVWSIGVILYILLSGTAPFDGPTDEDIMNKVKEGKFKFRTKIWESISDSAKDLILKMLNYNPEARISASEAYMHPWLQKQDFKTLKSELVNEISDNLTKFCVNFLIFIHLIYIY